VIIGLWNGFREKNYNLVYYKEKGNLENHPANPEMETPSL